MKLHAKLFMGLLVLGMPAMYAVSMKEIQLNNKTPDKAENRIGVTIVTETGGIGTASVDPNGTETLTVIGDAPGQIKAIRTSRLKGDKIKVNILYASDVNKQQLPLPKHENDVIKYVDPDKLKGLESLTFKYEGRFIKNFTIEGKDSNDRPVKLLP